MFHTHSHQGVLNKPSVHLSSGFLHFSMHQISAKCPVGSRPCSKCLGSLSEDLPLMEVGSENSREEGPGPPQIAMFLEIPEATQAHRKPFLHCPGQAHRSLETSCSFTGGWHDSKSKRENLFLHSHLLQRGTLCWGASMGRDSGPLSHESQAAVVSAE